MKQILISSIFLIVCISGVFSQKIDSTFAIDNFLKLNVDSIEIRTIKSEKDSFSVQLIHYSIINISEDSLIFMAESIHEYYRYSLTLDNKTFNEQIYGVIYRINPSYSHLIAPDMSFPYAISTPPHLEFIDDNLTSLNLTIPITIDSLVYINRGYKDEILSKKYRFHITDLGRFECKQNLIFEGETQVVFNTIIKESKPKRRLFRRRNKD